MASDTMNMNMSISATPPNTPVNYPNNVIGEFKGRAVIPLQRLDEEDYTVFGSLEIDDAIKKGKKDKKDKKEVTKFVVATIYEDVRQHTAALSNERRNNSFPFDDARIKALSKMENKEEMDKNLTGTKACKNIERTSTGEFGVCYREICTFAHSLEELNDPMCGFDSVCRHRLGKVQRDSTVDKTLKCMYRHTDETREEWVNRTGCVIPDLPKTSEKTRKPVARKDAVPVVKPKVSAVVPVFTRPVTPIPDAPVKAWGIETPVVQPETPIPSVSVEAAETTRKYKDDKYDSDRSSDSYSRHRSRSPRRHHRHSSRRVIIVPTNHLAEVAIKAAFNHGIYDLQVIIG